MLTELAVTNLGVIRQARLVLSDAMTALTGETGAGKTMIVQAVHLLTGGRSEAMMVRTGAAEAVVEGRFIYEPDGATPGQTTEIILKRVVSAKGRSRAYADDSMVTLERLSELGRELIDLHGQHQHQSLLSARTQRHALDSYGKVDLEPLRQTQAELRQLHSELAALGGDQRALAQEADLLRYQVAEIDAANIQDPAELEQLAALEDQLADATALIAAGNAARNALSDEEFDGQNGALDKLGAALAALADRALFAEIAKKLQSAQAELADVASELRDLTESTSEDPQQLEQTRARRQLLLDLTRKYGDSLAEVAAFSQQASQRLEQIEQHDQLAAELELAITAAEKKVAAAAAKVAHARRQAAPRLAAEVQAFFPSLAMPNAELNVVVGGEDPGDEVEMLVATNSGQKPGPLTKVASGGELARVMLALRLVLTAGPPTLIFDEVDAGIGGETAMAVGQALAQLADDHQVLVVTHLPQVGAFAHQQVTVRKTDDGTTAESDVVSLDETGRVAELTRMLSGMTDSASGQLHATELLSAAAASRGLGRNKLA